MSIVLVLSLLLLAALAAVRLVPSGQVYSLHRFGKPARLLQPGVHVVLPMLDRVAHKIHLDGQVLRFDEPLMAAQGVRGTVYWQVLEPERADAVFDHVDQLIRRGAHAALNAELSIDHDNQRALSARMKHSLNQALRERGMMVTRVELEVA